MSKASYWKKRALAFRFAWRGLRYLVQTESHFRIHLLAAFGACAFFWGMGISLLEWSLVSTCIVLVLACEAMNSAVEEICNRITIQPDSRIGRAKDMAAGACLLMAGNAMVVGLVILVRNI